MKIEKHDLSSAIQVLTHLGELGFRGDFKVQGQKLVSADASAEFTPDRLALIASYRFEGPSNPDDNTIIYALRADDGTGIVICDSFGPASSQALSKLLEGVRDEREDSELMEHLPPPKTIVIKSVEPEAKKS